MRIRVVRNYGLSPAAFPTRTQLDVAAALAGGCQGLTLTDAEIDTVEHIIALLVYRSSPSTSNPPIRPSWRSPSALPH